MGCATAGDAEFRESYMKIAPMLATGMVVIAATCAAPVAKATDWKANSTANCKPYGTTTEADLAFTAYGVANKSTTAAKSVVCALTTDGEGMITAEAELSVWVGLTAGATSGNVFCTVYYGTRATGLVARSVNSPWVAPGASSEGSVSVDFDAPPVTMGSYPALPLTAVCTLSPRTNLNALWVEESLPTEMAGLPPI
jgi:hypothetical protein